MRARNTKFSRCARTHKQKHICQSKTITRTHTNHLITQQGCQSSLPYRPKLPVKLKNKQRLIKNIRKSHIQTRLESVQRVQILQCVIIKCL